MANYPIIGKPGSTQHSNTMQLAVANCMAMEIMDWITVYVKRFRKLYAENCNKTPEEYASLLSAVNSAGTDESVESKCQTSGKGGL